MKKITLRPGKEMPVKRLHPWIFSGAIKKKAKGLVEGDWVEVYSASQELLATGHYHDSSIAVRVLQFGQIEDKEQFWQQRIQNAVDYRRQLDIPNAITNCYRLIHAEGDGLPGLIVDVYNGVAVVQCHSIGMQRDTELIVKALQTVLGDQLKAIYSKSKATLPKIATTADSDGYLWQTAEPVVAIENDHQFFVDWESGQKTGFFLDQRDNRQLLAQYVAGKSVLNAFCYSGGFSVYALKAGARQVDSVDISARAMAWTDKNITLNGDFDNHNSITADVMQFLKTAHTYEIIVIDPPAFAKNIRKRHAAVQGYKRLNTLAMKKVAPGGLLFTFSCSQVVDRQLFEDTVTAAALEVGRSVRILHYVSQAPDHPVNLYHKESSYLKGLVLQMS
ncbi:MAG: class I SAM-dependent rRNA methyltransferase [Bacteroidota bacterium]